MKEHINYVNPYKVVYGSKPTLYGNAGQAAYHTGRVAYKTLKNAAKYAGLYKSPSYNTNKITATNFLLKKVNNLNPKRVNSNENFYSLPPLQSLRQPSPRVNTPRVNTPRVNTPRPHVNTPRVNTPRPRVNTPRVNTPRPHVNTPRPNLVPIANSPRPNLVPTANIPEPLAPLQLPNITPRQRTSTHYGLPESPKNYSNLTNWNKYLEDLNPFPKATNNQSKGREASKESEESASNASPPNEFIYSGSEASGSAASGSEASGSEASGSEASGSAASGSAASGSEASGSEASEESEASGSEASGSEASEASEPTVNPIHSQALQESRNKFKEAQTLNEWSENEVPLPKVHPRVTRNKSQSMRRVREKHQRFLQAQQDLKNEWSENEVPLPKVHPRVTRNKSQSMRRAREKYQRFLQAQAKHQERTRRKENILGKLRKSVKKSSRKFKMKQSKSKVYRDAKAYSARFHKSRVKKKQLEKEKRYRMAVSKIQSHRDRERLGDYVDSLQGKPVFDPQHVKQYVQQNI